MEEEVHLLKKCQTVGLFNDRYLKHLRLLRQTVNICLTALVMIFHLTYDRSNRSLWWYAGSERYRTHLERGFTLLLRSRSTSVSFTMFGDACTHWRAADSSNQTPPYLLHFTACHGTPAVSYFRPVTVDMTCLWWETPGVSIWRWKNSAQRVISDVPTLIVPRFFEYTV